VCILRANDIEGVDGVGVSCCTERRFDNRKGFRASIPDEYLACIGTTDDEIRMEGRESY